MMYYLTFGYRILKSQIDKEFFVSTPGKYKLNISSNSKGKQIQKKEWIEEPRKFYLFQDQEIVQSEEKTELESLIELIIKTSRISSIVYSLNEEYIFFYIPLIGQYERLSSSKDEHISGVSDLEELKMNERYLSGFGEYLNSLGIKNNLEIFIREG